ncbi:hypothetical protein POM88_042310 [Heracleum sosnowskyi]|uniref:Protein kinase domain-containing protein n=1 Tax=Heracleum sosnowskyi TaxID=360622 RepID=A0AAD8HHY7_9APIA|nr:hypothetical protein POM88_042310 [Heracleum sosnowskyi]
MANEVPGTSGEKSKEYVTEADSFYSRGLRNISVQTGEEFSPEFLRDRVMSQKCGASDMDRYQQTVGVNLDNDQQLVCIERSGSIEALKRSSLSNESVYDRATESPSSPVNKANSPSSYRSSSPAHKSGSPNSNQLTAGVSDGYSLSTKIKFLCSYGGRIMLRQNDGKLRYIGGETRIISIRKSVTYMELVSKTFAICNQPHTIKYQLPGEDLDALISVSSDEDLQLMIDEYHDLQRSSQRLRIFLESTNESENPFPLDTRTVQHSDADYQYVIALNGMQDQNLHSSSSTESLSSYCGCNVDNSPKFQRDSPTTLHPWEIRDGGSRMIGNMMLSNLNPQVYNSPRVRTKRLVHSPSSPAFMQVKFHKNSPMKICEVGTSQDGCEGNTLCASKRRSNEKIYCHHQDISMGKSSYKNANPLIDPEPFSPLNDQGRDLEPEKPMLNILSPENVPYKNTTDLLSDSSCLQCQSAISQLELQRQNRPNYCMKEGIVSKKDLSILKASDARKTCNKWDQDSKYFEAHEDSLLGQNQNLAERNASKAVQIDGIEPKTKLANIQCSPNLRINPHKSSRDGPGDGSGISKNLEEDDQIVTNLSERSPATDTILAKVAYSYEDVVDERQHDAEIENSTMFVESVNPNNQDESNMSRAPIIVEDVTDNMPSDRVPFVQDEPSEIDTESDPLKLDSDCKDLTGADVGESISDPVLAEMEAGIYNLQIIKNTDLEDLQELGSGTYGTVYHGKWRGTDVAIKRIKKSCFVGRSSEQERLTKDFWREAHILSKLHHPNVVAFYGVVPDGPERTLATVTEFMVNGSLRHVLLKKKNRTLDLRKKLIIARDAAFGMEYLHMKNIVHFDLKCDNLLVNLGDPKRPICKVGDFGLSRIKRNTLVSGGVRGTLPWMAPELLDGSSSRVSEKVDIYSFGIAMWEILTGEEPYANMHCGAIIGGIVNNTLRPPVPAHCDAEWRNLMEECWSPDPTLRPSFTEITNRLQLMSMAVQPTRHIQVKR